MGVLGTNLLLTKTGLTTVAEAHAKQETVFVSTGLVWMPTRIERVTLPATTKLYRVTLSNGYSVDVAGDQALPLATGDIALSDHLLSAVSVENTTLQPAYYVPPVKTVAPSIKAYGDRIPHIAVGYHKWDELLIKLTTERAPYADALQSEFRTFTEEDVFEFVGRLCSVNGYWHVTKNITIGCRFRVPDKDCAHVLALLLARLNLPFEVSYSKKVFTSASGLDLMHQGQTWSAFPYSYYVTLRKFDHRILPLTIDSTLSFFREQEHIRHLTKYHKMFRRKQLSVLQQEKSKLRLRYVESLPRTGDLTYAYRTTEPLSKYLVGTLHCLP